MIGWSNKITTQLAARPNLWLVSPNLYICGAFTSHFFATVGWGAHTW